MGEKDSLDGKKMSVNLYRHSGLSSLVKSKSANCCCYYFRLKVCVWLVVRLFLWKRGICESFLVLIYTIILYYIEGKFIIYVCGVKTV